MKNSLFLKDEKLKEAKEETPDVDKVSEYFKKIYGTDPLNKSKGLQVPNLEERESNAPEELSIEERLRRIQSRMKAE